jgi:hypothetical protein
MRSRLQALSSCGIPTEFHTYDGLPHGFGLGAGTVAEGWLDDAAAFEERNMNPFTYSREIGMPANFRELGIPDDLPWKESADSVTLTSGGGGHLTHEDVLKIFESCRKS